MDIDNDVATGGPVSVEQGSEAPHDEMGIDDRVQACANPGPSMITTSIAAPEDGFVDATLVYEWNGSSFQLVSSTVFDPPIGDGEGLNGSQLVEFQAPRSLFDNPAPGGPMRIVFHATGGVVPASDYTAAAILQEQSVLEIPTISGWALLTIAALLAGARRRAAAPGLKRLRRFRLPGRRAGPARRRDRWRPATARRGP